MTQHYRVTSVFRDAKNKELRRADTFSGEAEDARAALIGAHSGMQEFVEGDSRIDVIVSEVKGENGESISTTDYANELSWISGQGLTKELDASMLDGLDAKDQLREALGVMGVDPDDLDMEKIAEVTEAAAAAQGGPVPARDPFRPGADTPADIDAAGHPSSSGSDRGSSRESGGRSRGVDPGQRGVRADGVQRHAGDQSDRGSGSVSQPARNPPPPAVDLRGLPHQHRGVQGSVTQQISDALEDIKRTNKKATGIKLSPQTWDQLQQQLKDDGMLPGGSTMLNVHIMGLPVVKNLNPGCPPIQIVAKNKRASGSGGRLFIDGADFGQVRDFQISTGHAPAGLPPGEFIFLPESEEQKASRRKLEKWMRLGQPRGISSKELFIMDEKADIDESVWARLWAQVKAPEYMRKYLAHWPDKEKTNAD